MEKRLREYLKANLSEKRFRHSEATGDVARELCGIYGLPAEKGLIAGLGHDIAREKSPAEIAELAESMFSVEKWEKEHIIMLHGKAGAAMLNRDLGVEDRTILEAVAWHTTGFPGMGDLVKIVYIADYIEPNRKHPGSNFAGELVNYSLDDAFIAILGKKMEYLKKKGRRPAPPTASLLEAIGDIRLTS